MIGKWMKVMGKLELLIAVFQKMKEVVVSTQKKKKKKRKIKGMKMMKKSNNEDGDKMKGMKMMGVRSIFFLKDDQYVEEKGRILWWVENCCLR